MPANVSLVDVVPTVVQILDLEAFPGDGWSLLEPNHDWTGRPVLSEAIAYGHDKASVVRGDAKLLSSPGDGYERTFALGPDRRESGVLEDRELAAELRGYLPTESRVGIQVEATREIEDHLRDLGYIE